MAYRADDEPEYIDDDDYYDPDDASGPGARSSRVLGGSGTRCATNGPRDPAPIIPPPRDKRRNKGARRTVKARNPAPAAASSAERRARLAGKAARSDETPAPAPADSDAPKRRFSALRARFSRGEAQPEARGKGSRLGALGSGIGGRLGKLRVPGRERDDADPRGRSQASRARRQRTSADSPPSARTSKTPRIANDGWLDLDRKLDLIGVALVFGAIVLGISALSAGQAAIGVIHRLIGQALGWGALAVPIAMFAIGMWLIVRHFGDSAPTVDLIRLTGMALAFLAALTLFQYADSFLNAGEMTSMEACRNPATSACVEAMARRAYQSGQGGGLIGGWVYGALVNNLTELGGFIGVLMLLTMSAMMITRSSMAELSAVALGMGRGLGTRLARYRVERRAMRLRARQEALSQPETQVHVSKPEPARLEGAKPNLQALPEPTAATMPIPRRVFDRLGFWRKPEHAASARSETPAEHVADPSPPARRQPLRPAWKRVPPQEAPSASESPQVERMPRSGALERFLNLGDDIPPPTRPASPLREAPNEPRPPKPAPRPETKDPPPELSMEDLHDLIAQQGPPPAIPALDPPAREDAAKRDAKSKKRKRTPEPSERANWALPDIYELLTRGMAGELDHEPLTRQAQIIEDTLASFGAPGHVVEINSGPVITQYGVEPAYARARNDKKSRVKVSAIAKLDKDLQLALNARSIRVEAPVPGKGYVGIEVPNPEAALVSLRDVMESRAYQRIESPLAIALGMSVDGAPVSADLTQMPHLLIAGTTGSGKSKCINAIIISLLSTRSPDEVKFIMIDPKRVELTGYNGLPHLVAPVVVELERAVGALRWATNEMDARYKTFSQAGARNIIDYNSILDPDEAPMPYIVVIIDELADLMMMAPDDTERAVTRIAALARATGIHLVIATQRPSVDVVTGLIKANCPARIAFAVAGGVDSRVILDQPGAERLLGKGDMLYLSGDSPAPRRMQGVFVSDEEIRRVVRFWKLQSAGVEAVKPIKIPAVSSGKLAPPKPGPSKTRTPPDQNEAQTAFWDMSPTHDPPGGNTSQPDEDELYQTAVDLVRRLDKASTSLLQRRLRIGYSRAARLMDVMEERRVIGPPKEGSSKPRDVLPPKLAQS